VPPADTAAARRIVGSMHAGHHGHAHAAPGQADKGRLRLALALIAGFIAVEVATGVIAHSLALLSDAAHMVTDAGALALSLLALRLAARPAAGAMTFGFRRAEILSAQANGISLVIFAGFIAYEAIRRLLDPAAVRGGLMLAVALAGIVVNLAAVRVLAGADRSSLNVQGSFQHVLTDLYGFIGTAIAAVVIIATGFGRADPIVSLLIVALMLRSGYGLLRASGRVFLAAAPAGLDPQAVGRALAARAGVVEVHDLHVWEVSSGFPALSAHVLVSPDTDCHAARRELEALLQERFGIDHTTLQVDHDRERLIGIEPIERLEVGTPPNVPR
jgi:cobalt-zinc-cadmium efflux system protein